jgi:hypothetical protein
MMAPDPTFAFVGGPCFLTLDFVIALFFLFLLFFIIIIITFYTLLTLLFCIVSSLTKIGLLVLIFQFF